MYLEWDHAENGVPLLKRKEVVHVAHKQVRAEFLTVQVYIVRQKGQLRQVGPVGPLGIMGLIVTLYQDNRTVLAKASEMLISAFRGTLTGKNTKSEKFLILPQVSDAIDWKKTEVHCTPCSFQAPQTLELPLELSAELQDLWINYLSVDQWLGGMFE